MYTRNKHTFGRCYDLVLPQLCLILQQCAIRHCWNTARAAVCGARVFIICAGKFNVHITGIFGSWLAQLEIPPQIKECRFCKSFWTGVDHVAPLFVPLHTVWAAIQLVSYTCSCCFLNGLCLFCCRSCEQISSNLEKKMERVHSTQKPKAKMDFVHRHTFWIYIANYKKSLFISTTFLLGEQSAPNECRQNKLYTPQLKETWAKSTDKLRQFTYCYCCGSQWQHVYSCASILGALKRYLDGQIVLHLFHFSRCDGEKMSSYQMNGMQTPWAISLALYHIFAIFRNRSD